MIKRNPDLHYSQGYNQICTVFYIAGGINIGFYLSERCARTMLIDSMRKSFEDGLIQQMNLIYDILDICDEAVSNKLKSIYTYNSSVGTPTIAIP